MSRLYINFGLCIFLFLIDPSAVLYAEHWSCTVKFSYQSWSICCIDTTVSGNIQWNLGWRLLWDEFFHKIWIRTHGDQYCTPYSWHQFTVREKEPIYGVLCMTHWKRVLHSCLHWTSLDQLIFTSTFTVSKLEKTCMINQGHIQGRGAARLQPTPPNCHKTKI
jgi:hypothetical protein